MKSDKDKAIKKEDVKILKVRKAQKKTPEQIEEENRQREEKKAVRARKRVKKDGDEIKKPAAEKKPAGSTAAPNVIQDDAAPLIAPPKAEKTFEESYNDAESSPALTVQVCETVKKKILFLCTGNTCRSPMAEFIFKAAAVKHGRADEYEVSSAGLAASGDPLSENAAYALTALGIPFTNRISVQMSVQHAKNADLIICMTASHRAAMGGIENCVTLSDLSGCGDIPDPYGQSKDAYLNTARALTAAIERLFK